MKALAGCRLGVSRTPARVLAIVLLPIASAAASKAEQAAFAVVKDFYEAANRKQCEAAANFMTEDSLVQQTLAGQGGFEAFCRDRGGRAALQGIFLVKAEVKKTVATVLAERQYKDGSSSRELEHLVNVDGTWKLTLPSKAAAP